MHDEWINTPTVPVIDFMNRAENEYNIQMQMGTWKAPTKKDLELLALKATVAKFEKEVMGKKKDTTGGGNNTPRKNYADRIKDEKKNSPRKFEAPGMGEPWSNQMERQTYNWCSKHGKWVTTHKDSECLGINA
jgi:hypothetical protein